MGKESLFKQIKEEKIVAVCGYCGNRYGYGADPDGVCPVCEHNYRKEDNNKK